MVQHLAARVFSMINNKRSESTNRCSQNVIKHQLQIILNFNQIVTIFMNTHTKKQI